MKAFVLNEIKHPLVYADFPDPEPEEGQVVVELKYAALNHRDAFIRKGLYPGIQPPVVPGSDGAGLLDGQAVILNPNIGWGKEEKVQDGKYHILGLPSNGTFAEKVAVKADRVVAKPDHLSWEQAAALPLAGLTAYRALFSRGRLQEGERVLISGIGGGVALFACQFAIAAGAEVYVTSSSAAKIERALELGAKGGQLYTEAGWGRKWAKAGNGFDLIIDSAAGEGFGELVDAANPAARIVIYGGTRGKAPLNPQRLFWKQLDILGSTMGSDQDFTDMVGFVRKNKIHPVVDSVFPLSDGNKALDRMDAGGQFGKIVLKINE
jgi:zinc-binding alcohol dehydrogenase/oxidoreductase